MRRTVISALLGGALAASLAVAPNTPAFAAAPANDMFANAAPIPASGGTVIGDNSEATAERGSADPGVPDEPDHGNSGWGALHSVWWTWTATKDGDVTVSTCDSAFDTRLGVYTGSAVTALTTVVMAQDSTDPSCANAKFAVAHFTATAGTTYRIAVDTNGDLAGDGSGPPRGPIKLKLTPPPSGPQNDMFADAGPMPAEGGTYVGTNVSASPESGEPAHAHSGAAVHSIWYAWTAAKSGSAKISTCGSGFNTRLGVYTGSAVNALTEVAYNEDGNDAACSDPKFAVVTFNAVAGTTYRIAVDTSGGVPDNSGAPQGDVHITLTAPSGDQPPPPDDDTNPGTEVTEQPVPVTVPRFKPRCAQVKGELAADDCPDNATKMKFASVEAYQTWPGRFKVLREWVSEQEAAGADITLSLAPRAANTAPSNALVQELRAVGHGGEILTQNVEPGTVVNTTAAEPLLLKIKYYDWAEENKLLNAELASLVKAGEDRKDVKSPCEFIASDATFDAIERKLGEKLGGGTLTQKRAGAILKSYGCNYEVAQYVDGAGFSTDVVLDVVGVDKKRNVIQLKVALPVRQDFLFVISEEPVFSRTDNLGLGVDGRLTASSKQNNLFTVQVLERTTGRLVPGVLLDFWDLNGKPVTEKTNEKGEWTFTSKMPVAGSYLLKGTYTAGGVKMVGFRQIDVVDRKASYVTMSGRSMTWSGGTYTGTQADIDRARAMAVVPASLGTGLTSAPTAPPTIQQISAAVPTAHGVVTGMHNGIAISDNTNFAVGSASGLVVIGGGLPPQTGSAKPTAARAWPNPFQAVANMLNTIVTGLQRTFSQGANGEGTVATKTTPADQAKVSTSASTLSAYGASTPPSGLISDKGLGVISTGGGNVISTGGGNVISTGGLNGTSGVISTGGGNVISTGGGNVISVGGGNVISTGGGNVMPVYGGNVISTGGGN